MTASTGTKIVDPSDPCVLASVNAVEDGERSWKPATGHPWVRTAVQLVGLVLGGSGLLLGLGVVWTQLARALPLAELLDRPRAVPALLLVVGGLGLFLAGRHGATISTARSSARLLPSR
jgi:hypothetical protein